MCDVKIMHKHLSEICETSWQNKGHVLVTVKWKCSSAEVNMAAVQRRSLSPVCPMGSCLSSGPMMGTQKLDAGYPERNEDGISRRLMERPSVICKHIMVMSKQPEWNLQPWTDFQRVNFQLTDNLCPKKQVAMKPDSITVKPLNCDFKKIKTCEGC